MVNRLGKNHNEFVIITVGIPSIERICGIGDQVDEYVLNFMATATYYWEIFGNKHPDFSLSIADTGSDERQCSLYDIFNLGSTMLLRSWRGKREQVHYDGRPHT